MKVSVLRGILAALPSEMEIKMSIDPEGNNYRSLDEAEVWVWDDYSNEPKCEEDYAGLPVDGPKVLLLWPR